MDPMDEKRFWEMAGQMFASHDQKQDSVDDRFREKVNNAGAVLIFGKLFEFIQKETFDYGLLYMAKFMSPNVTNVFLASTGNLSALKMFKLQPEAFLFICMLMIPYKPFCTALRKEETLLKFILKIAEAHIENGLEGWGYLVAVSFESICDGLLHKESVSYKRATCFEKLGFFQMIFRMSAALMDRVKTELKSDDLKEVFLAQMLRSANNLVHILGELAEKCESITGIVQEHFEQFISVYLYMWEVEKKNDVGALPRTVIHRGIYNLFRWFVYHDPGLKLLMMGHKEFMEFCEEATQSARDSKFHDVFLIEELFFCVSGMIVPDSYEKKPFLYFCSFSGCSKRELQSEISYGRGKTKFKTCSGCKSVYYCSVRCQKKDWKKGHKGVCQKFEDTKHYRQKFKANSSSEK